MFRNNSWQTNEIRVSNFGGMKIVREGEVREIKTCPSINVSTLDPVRTGLRLTFRHRASSI